MPRNNEGASHLQQVGLVLRHDAVAVERGEDAVQHGLRRLLVQPLAGHQAGGQQPRVLSQLAQELPVRALLEAQRLVPLQELRVLQGPGVLAALCRRRLRTAGGGGGRGRVPSANHVLGPDTSRGLQPRARATLPF